MIPNTQTYIQALSTGSNTVYSFPNKIDLASDLAITAIDPSSNQYSFLFQSGAVFSNGPLGITATVTGVDIDTGCTVTLSGPLAANWSLDIRSLIPETQTTSIKNQGQFLPDLHEEAFDRATRQIQDLNRRAYTFGVHGPDTEGTPWPALPGPTVRANTGLIFDANGLPAIGVIPTTTFTQVLFNAFLATSPPFARTAEEILNGVIPTTTYFWPGDLRRYGGVADGNGTGGGTDNTLALGQANSSGHRVLVQGGGIYRVASIKVITAGLYVDANTSIAMDNGTLLTLQGPVQLVSTFPFSGYGSVVLNYVSTPGKIANKVPGFAAGVPIYPNAPFDSFGDSYTAGNGATSGATCFAAILGSRFNTTFNNWGVGGTGVTKPIFQAFSHLPKYKLRGRSMTWMAGFNDLFRQGPTVPTLQKISDCTNAFLANAFLEFAVPASDPSVTKSGTWAGVTPGVFGDKSSLALNGLAEQSSTFNDSLTWTFTGENVVVGFWSSDGTVRVLSPFTVTIDGNVVDTVTPNGATDGNQGGVDTYQGFTYNVRVYTSLGSGSHTIRVINTQSNYLIIDYFGTLSPPGECPSILMGEIANLNAAGYAAEPLRSRLIDSNTSLVEQAIVDQWQRWGYPVAWVPVNDYYNVTLNAYVDNIHPSQAGHVQIAQAFSSRAYPAMVSQVIGMSVVKTGTQSIANTTNTLISWDASFNDSENFWSNSNPTVITAPASGTMRIAGNIGFAANPTGVRTATIFKNAVSYKTVGGSAATPTNTCIVPFTLDVIVNVGDQITVNVSQNSGSAVNLTTDTQLDISMVR